jgi:beta-lactamase class D
MNASFDRDDFPFWLNGSLQISADEQLRFLQAFYEEELVFSDRTTAIVKDIILREETDTYRLSGKTGSGLTRDGVALGWFMGYVETQDNVYYFVTNMDAVGDIRVDLSRRILVELGVLPE